MNLPAPEFLAREIAENLEAALQQFNGIYEALLRYYRTRPQSATVRRALKQIRAN